MGTLYALRRRYRTALVVGLAVAVVSGIAGTGLADTQRRPTARPAAGSVEQPAGAAAAYQVVDGVLHDPCGNEVVLRGVNKMAVFTDRSGNSFPEIAKTGANAVRFMWFASVPAAEAVQTLQRAVDSQLIPIWELHDATGDFDKMAAIEAYWTAPDTIAVLKQFEAHLIVNLANEAGTTVEDSRFVATYSRIIGKLRDAGLRMPIMVDAAGFGRNVEQLLRLAPDVLAADPLRNVMFSWHVYDPGSGQQARIDRAVATAAEQRILLLVGEFGSVSPGACQSSVPYKYLIQRAMETGLGYLAWSWDGDNSDCKNGDHSAFDMVSDGIHLSTLRSGYPRDVVFDEPGSIANTSRRTTWQVSGQCD